MRFEWGKWSWKHLEAMKFSLCGVWDSPLFWGWKDQGSWEFFFPFGCQWYQSRTVSALPGVNFRKKMNATMRHQFLRHERPRIAGVLDIRSLWTSWTMMWVCDIRQIHVFCQLNQTWFMIHTQNLLKLRRVSSTGPATATETGRGPPFHPSKRWWGPIQRSLGCTLELVIYIKVDIVTCCSIKCPRKTVTWRVFIRKSMGIFWKSSVMTFPW